MNFFYVSLNSYRDNHKNFPIAAEAKQAVIEMFDDGYVIPVQRKDYSLFDFLRYHPSAPYLPERDTSRTVIPSAARDLNNSGSPTISVCANYF